MPEASASISGGGVASASGDGVLLTADSVSRRYATAAGSLEVLRAVSLDVRIGEIVAITGESGTGKSTLLHILGALDRPTSGSVRYEGEDIFAMGDEELAGFRNRSVGFVFQFHHLLPEFTALENVAMPALIGGSSLASAAPRAGSLLDLLGLAARQEHRPSQLSGGEQQRVAVARALMNEPRLVLMDEPTGNLDTRTAEALHDEIVRLCRQRGQTFVIVTHNPSLAARADRVLDLHDGQLTEAAS